MNAPEFSVEAFLESLAECLPGERPLALHEPEFMGNERAYVLDCLDTGWVSSVGAYVDRFETDLVAYTGAAAAVACVNGTAALQVALRLAGVEPSDEVLIPSLTFVATANAVAHIGAVPHFIDASESTLGMSPDALSARLNQIAVQRDGSLFNRQTGRRLAAIVPVHVFGHPCDMEGIAGAACTFGLPVVEDATESLGSRRGERHCGTFAPIGVLSFNGNKIITTGGGGALLLQDADLARHAKHLTTTAKVAHPWVYEHDEVGYNYRMPNINAALGCAQLERLPDILARKRSLAASYEQKLSGVAGMRFVTEPEGAYSNYWLNAVLLDPPQAGVRDAVLDAANARGLGMRPAWTPLHRLPMYLDCPRGALDQTERLFAGLLNLPSGPALAHG